MNTRAIKINPYFKYLLPLLIITSSTLLSKLVVLNPDLAIGITYDLTILSPLIYLFLIRKTSIPKITTLPFFIGGIVIASLILPNHLKSHLNFIITYIVPIIETSVISIIIYKCYRISKIFKSTSATSTDFYSLVMKSAIQVLGDSKFTKVFVTEITMIAYSIFIWKKVHPNEYQFTSYKENGNISFFGAVIFIIITETFIVHMLFHTWNETFIWILTIGSLYGGLQIFSHIKSLKRRFSEIKNDQLILKYGLFGDVEIDISSIKSIELTSNEVDNKLYKVEKMALLKDFESHNIAIYFNENIEIKGAYGRVKSCNVILTQIDDKQRFIDEITGKLNRNKS